MILNKYNEIMERITLDPEAKSRIMSAVSANIKEQSSDKAVVTDIPEDEEKEDIDEIKPVRKKARRTPIVVISSIAAAIVVIAGVLFVFRLMGSTKKAESTNAVKDLYTGNAAAETTMAAEDCSSDEMEFDGNLDANNAQKVVDRNIDGSNNVNSYIERITGDVSIDYKCDDDVTEGMGDARRDKISRALPFDLKGTGTGQFSDEISTEIFIGNEPGEKVVILTGPEGTDLVKEFYSANKSLGEPAVTPDGTAVKLFRIPFGNVLELGKDEVSTDLNAAFYTKDGKTYLLIFSDIQSKEVILGLVDAV